MGINIDLSKNNNVMSIENSLYGKHHCIHMHTHKHVSEYNEANDKLALAVNNLFRMHDT